MKTYTPKPTDITRKWYLIDASGKTLGRLASEIAKILRGKHKPIYSPHIDTGDHIIVVNAEKVRVTGRKQEQKMYYRHSGYPGGLKETSFAELQRKYPTRIIKYAVKGMLPHNKLGRKMIDKLQIYAGTEHPHQAQQPVELEIS